MQNHFKSLVGIIKADNGFVIINTENNNLAFCSNYDELQTKIATLFGDDIHKINLEKELDAMVAENQKAGLYE